MADRMWSPFTTVDEDLTDHIRSAIASLPDAPVSRDLNARTRREKAIRDRSCSSLFRRSRLGAAVNSCGAVDEAA
jgi:hypothetical protein